MAQRFSRLTRHARTLAQHTARTHTTHTNAHDTTRARERFDTEWRRCARGCVAKLFCLSEGLFFVGFWRASMTADLLGEVWVGFRDAFGCWELSRIHSTRWSIVRYFKINNNTNVHRLTSAGWRRTPFSAFASIRRTPLCGARCRRCRLCRRWRGSVGGWSESKPRGWVPTVSGNNVDKCCADTPVHRIRS